MVRYRDGTTEEFDNLVHDKWRYEGFRDLVRAIREDAPPLCTPRLARSQTLTVNVMHDSCPESGVIPEEYVAETEDWEIFPPGTKGKFRHIRGLDEYMRVAIEEWSFLSEMGIPWARTSRQKSVDAGRYVRFPGTAV